jgi:hypothetical protein
MWWPHRVSNPRPSCLYALKERCKQMKAHTHCRWRTWYLDPDRNWTSSARISSSGHPSRSKWLSRRLQTRELSLFHCCRTRSYATEPMQTGQRVTTFRFCSVWTRYRVMTSKQTAKQHSLLGNRFLISIRSRHWVTSLQTNTLARNNKWTVFSTLSASRCYNRDKLVSCNRLKYPSHQSVCLM